MARCRDCIHFNDCLSYGKTRYYGENSACNDVQERCKYFKDKADVVEVKRGEWIYHECVSSYDGAKSGYSCSVCSAFVNDEVFESDGFHKDFCGHCGADMRGG